MSIDNRIVIYNFTQFRHNQAVRRKYRLTNPNIQVLCSVYYSTIIKKMNHCKSYIMKLNSSMNQVYIESTLLLLSDRGLLDYIKTDNIHKYTFKVSKEGLSVMSLLYSEEAIDKLINKY